MKISTRKLGDATIVDLDGDLKTPADMEEFSVFIDRELAGGSRKFVLDFAKVHFINSSGLGRLILASKKISEKNGSVGVVGLIKEVDELFTITRIKEKIPVFTDEKTALDHLH
jgi:anti-sigma B factor antagonist